MKKRKSCLLNSILVLFSIVVSLLIGEVIIRIFVITPVEYVIKDPLVGHKYLPNTNINKRDAESKREVKKECEDHGSQYLLVSIPRPHQVYDDYWKSTSEKYETFTGLKWDRTKPERILERFTKEENISYISLLPLFQQDHKRSGKRVSFGGGHFSEYGHSVVANILYAQLSGVY